MRRVVRPRASVDRRVARLGHRKLEQAIVLLVGERRTLTCGAGDHYAVAPVFQQVLEQAHERLLVDGSIRRERRDHRRDDASNRHGGDYLRLGYWIGLKGSGVASMPSLGGAFSTGFSSTAGCSSSAAWSAGDWGWFTCAAGLCWAGSPCGAGVGVA